MSTDRTSSGGYGELLRQSLAAIDSLESEVGRLRRELASRPSTEAGEPVAIVGAACRFPGGANDLDSYWHLLDNGIDAVTPVPPERRALGGWKSTSGGERYAGLIENLDQFDPKFFGISAREAATMDPQQRLVLEVGWEALENAGHAPGGMAGSSTGVFIGLSTSDYAHLIRESGAPSDVYVATGNAHNAVAGRLSFLLGLQGPSMAVDTACSSSLVAMHLACLSLRARNCRMALAGGVNVLLSEQPFECFSAWGMMAPDGKCKTFDISADGFVRSEGCGIVVLKRLSDAVADGDNIRALILGSAVNQDGRSSGLTVPNGPAQEAVIRQALAAAHIEPGDVDYVEAHGTGTSLGDPIEAQALAAALGAGRIKEHPLVVGSVKTNIGHLESAAGVAGLLKVVLSLERERVPAHLHYSQVNPKIDWAGTPVEVPSQPRDWRRGQRRRIAGISSFGFSGTNAHIIIEEGPQQEVIIAKAERPTHILSFSAKTTEALESTVARFRAELESHTGKLADIAYTGNVGRTQFRERLAVTARDINELRDKLAAGNLIKGAVQQVRGRLAFLFTGQGSQWPGMCRELYDTQPAFRDALDECAGGLHLEKPLLDVIYGRDAALLDQTAYTQPALFSIEWALARLWKSWGIEPDVVFGHSVGEFAALCAAGVWTLEDGLRMIAERGRMMQALGPGWGMAAVQSGSDKVQDALRGMEAFVSIAARNAPAGTVISGRLEELAEAQKRLTAAGVKSVRLTVSHGFHSSQMQGVAEEFARFAKQVPMHSPRCRIVSSVTGRFISLEELRDSNYWNRQVRNAVEFQTGMETLAAAGFDLFVEVGPAPVLCGLGRQCIGAEGRLWAPSVRRERGAWDQILESLAHLYVRGAEVNWTGFDTAYGRRRVVLPTYPFQRQRYWIEPGEPRTKKKATDGHPLLGEKIDIAGTPATYVWQNEISTTDLPYLGDHCIQGKVIFPGAAYIEMAAAAARQLFGHGPVEIRNCQFVAPIIFQPGEGERIQLIADHLGEDSFSFHIFTRHNADESWTLNASGKAFHIKDEQARKVDVPCPDRPPDLDGKKLYENLFESGIQFGPCFQGLGQAWRVPEGAVCDVRIAEQVAKEAGAYTFHPALIDSCFHPLLCATENAAGPMMMTGIGRMRIDRVPRGSILRVMASADAHGGSVRIVDENGSLVAEAEGIAGRPLDMQLLSPHHFDDWLFRLEWVATEKQAEKPIQTVDPGSGYWLVLTGDSASGSEVASVLQSQGLRCATLRMNSEFEQTGPSSFSVRPESVDDFRRVLDLMGQHTGVGCSGVLHLWALDAIVTRAREVPRVHRTACASVPALIQALANMPGSGRPRVWLVTAGAVAASEDIDISPFQSPIWGLGRVLAHEHPELWGGLVDLDPSASPADCARFLAQEIRQSDEEDQVAMRDTSRYVARLKRFRPSSGTVPGWRGDSTYLITGAFGGIGAVVARHLSEQGAKFVVLASRTKLPERAAWPGIDPDSSLGRRIALVRDLESRGVSVHPAVCDVSQEGAVEGLVAQLHNLGWPEVRGIFHAAGVVERKSIYETGSADLGNQSQAKIEGAWALHRAFEHTALDCFVLFSSGAALLGPPKLGAYAAANAFLDALAQHRTAKHLPALSIAWGPWTETGMFSREAATLDPLGKHGIEGISNAAGLSILENLLASTASNVAVLPINWKSWRGLAGKAVGRLLVDVAPPQKGGPRVEFDRQAFLAASGKERTAIIERYLAELVSRVLGFKVTDLATDQPLTALGMDSLTALEIGNVVQHDLGISLPLRVFFEAPNLGALATQLETVGWLQRERGNGAESTENREEFVL